jgi:hypothetical protein
MAAAVFHILKANICYIILSETLKRCFWIQFRYSLQAIENSRSESALRNAGYYRTLCIILSQKYPYVFNNTNYVLIRSVRNLRVE